MNSTDMALALRHLHPTARMPEDIALADDGTGPQIVGWNLPVPQPTAEELEAALPAAQARAQQQQDLNEADRELRQLQDNHSRALALGRTQEANEIMESAQEWLAYIGEVRGNAPS